MKIQHAQRLEDFNGTWRKVSGEGPEELRISNPFQPYNIVANDQCAFRRVNLGRMEWDDYEKLPLHKQPFQYDVHAHFSQMATFADGKVEDVSTVYKINEPGATGFGQTLRRCSQTMELAGDNLVIGSEVALLQRSAIWFGSFTRQISSTSSRGVYVRG